MIMIKYSLLQFKRLLRILPFVLTSVFVLFFCLIVVFSAIIDGQQEDGSIRFRLALVGSSDDPYLKAGLEVIQAYDSSRFAIETVQMEEQEALKALEKGEIGAYVVIPDGFIEEAMAGHIGSLKYVSTTGAAELITLFKDEITSVVSDIIIACEQAMYGIDDALRENGMEDRIGQFTNDISLTYVDYILNRTDMYSVEVLGSADSLGLSGYLFSGITVLLMTLLIIPFSSAYIKKDFSIDRLLKSKGVGAVSQVVGEYLALFGIFSAIFFVVSVCVSVFVGSNSPEITRIIGIFSLENYPKLLIVAFMITAFGYLLFQLADDLVSGVLVQFFSGLALCFVSGCLYPMYFFPDSLRVAASYFPQGGARVLLSSCITGTSAHNDVVALLMYGTAFIGLSILARAVRLRKEAG